MKEFNNREIAKQHAEYITGKELRLHVAKKVNELVGENPTIFDGAVGSGQLEQYINPKWIYGVEIQEKACEVFKENYPNSDISNMSFFNFESNIKADCILMNYPFSLKFKDLTDEEKTNIQKEFPWKKSGVVDDIFILKSLNYTKRYGVYIGFPGITYRKSEEKLRELIGNNLKELSIIQNAFEDTTIDIVLIVIDKNKTSKEVYQEIYDCKIKKVLKQEVVTNDVWVLPRVTEEKEEIDIDQLEKEIYRLKMKRRKIEDELDRFINKTFKEDLRLDEEQVSFFDI